VPAVVVAALVKLIVFGRENPVPVLVEKSSVGDPIVTPMPVAVVVGGTIAAV
jgi:hypothetical protein